MDLDDMLAQSTVELESAEADLQAAQQRVEELRTIQEGIRLAKNRYGQAQAATQGQAATLTGTVPSASPKAAGSPARRPRRRPAKRGHSQVNQSDLCLALLAELGRPVSSTEARERLGAQGHIYDAEQIRGAFAYLLRKEKIVRVEAGVWALPPSQNADADLPASALLQQGGRQVEPRPRIQHRKAHIHERTRPRPGISATSRRQVGHDQVCDRNVGDYGPALDRASGAIGADLPPDHLAHTSLTCMFDTAGSPGPRCWGRGTGVRPVALLRAQRSERGVGRPTTTPRWCLPGKRLLSNRVACPLRARSDGRPGRLTDTHGQVNAPSSCDDAGHNTCRAHSQVATRRATQG
jgi:hypothetical protein